MTRLQPFSRSETANKSTGIAYELKAAERSTRDCLLWYFGSTDPALIREQMEKLLRIQGEHKAILAERGRREKEDGEPVTMEWLRSLPGAVPNGQCCYFQLWRAANFRLFVQSDLGFVLAAFGQTIRLKDEWVQTKIQVLRLLEALGIERKGG